MSFEAVQWALEQEVGKSPAKFVLVAMASFVNAESREMVCWPSYAAIAAITHQDTKTVEAAVYRLKQERFIVDTGQRQGPTRKVVVYRLNDPKNGGVTPGLQSPGASGTRPHNNPKTGGVRAIGNPPEFPSNPPEFPAESPRISGRTTPKTGDGTRNGTSKGTRKEQGSARACAPAIPDVPVDLIADWMQVRKAKHAGPVNGTVIAGLTREAGKAGLTVADAVRYCCEAGWQNFNAGYYANRERGTVRPPAKAASRHNGFAQIDYTEGAKNGIPEA